MKMNIISDINITKKQHTVANTVATMLKTGGKANLN